RFNMPFELGMTMGAKRFTRSRKNDRIKIMVAEPYQLPKYLSDLGGNDPDAHRRDPKIVIGIARDFLDHAPGGRPLPGRANLIEPFKRFKEALPTIAKGIRHRVDEVHVRRNYRTFLWCVAFFLAGTNSLR